MESSSSNMIAPFVMKIYQMLCDPRTNRLIAWGRGNNSFIVLEPSDFSRRILPLYFKHNNFSSFVRQLNTYGFRKVDPDRWEFANEWFLCGQTQLLNKIQRRKHTSRAYTSLVIKHEEEDYDELAMEITKLKREQENLEEELESMHRRLEATETRPQQMRTFLSRVVEYPQALLQIMLKKDNERRLNDDSSSSKKRKIMECAASSSSSGMSMSSSSAKSEEDHDGPVLWPESSPQTPDERYSHSYAYLSSSTLVGPSGGSGGGGGAAAPPISGMKGYEYDTGAGVSNYFEALAAGEKTSQKKPAPYPFSLLDG